MTTLVGYELSNKVATLTMDDGNANVISAAIDADLADWQERCYGR